MEGIKGGNDIVRELVATIRACVIAKNEIAEFLQTDRYGGSEVCRYCGSDDVCSVCGTCGEDHALMMADALDNLDGDPVEAIRHFGINMLIMKAGDALTHGPEASTAMIYVGNPEEIVEGIRQHAGKRMAEIEDQEPMVDDDIWGDVFSDLFK